MLGYEPSSNTPVAAVTLHSCVPLQQPPSLLDLQHTPPEDASPRIKDKLFFTCSYCWNVQPVPPEGENVQQW